MADTDWPYPLLLAEVSRSQLETKIRELQQAIEDLPDKIRNQRNLVDGHFARVWFDTGLEVAAEEAEKVWFVS